MTSYHSKPRTEEWEAMQTIEGKSSPGRRNSMARGSNVEQQEPSRNIKKVTAEHRGEQHGKQCKSPIMQHRGFRPGFGPQLCVCVFLISYQIESKIT